MLKKMLLALFLRCPNCEKGHIGEGLWGVRKTCEVCNVVYERKPGESTGAMAVWMMTLPILALILFFVLFFINEDWSMWILLGGPSVFVILLGILGYRHIRGLWIGFTYITGGVYADEDAPVQDR